MDAAAARQGWEDRIARPVSLVTGTLDKMAANVRLSVNRIHLTHMLGSVVFVLLRVMYGPGKP